MKKLIAAAAVIAAMLACTKNEQPESGSTTNEGFQKGQQVTLTFSASYGDKEETPQTKVTSEWNSTTSAVDFKWEEGDHVKVTVVGSSEDPAVFTLSSGAGTSTATFTGVMPADGTQYTVQYPVNDPDITTQAYSSTEAIPHDMMKFAAECEYYSYKGPQYDVVLTAQNAALRLNLYGNYAVSKIEVTNTTSSIKYTLNCTNAVTLGTTAESATPFYIVVPEGNYKFSAEIFDNAADPASICTFEPSAPKDFKNGYVLNMSGAKEVKESVLLPGEFSVSTTKKVNFTKGNLYYSTTDSKYHIEAQQNVTSATLGQESYDPTHVTLFYWVTPSEATDAATAPWAESFGTHTQTTSDKFFCGKDNPMTVDGQSGLYALTTVEWDYLLNTRSVNGGTGDGYSYLRATINNDVNGGVYGMIIYPDNYISQTSATTYTSSEWTVMENAGCVFLPAAGYRNGSSLYDVGSYGSYWSSSPSASIAFYAYCLYFSSSGVYPGDDYPREGCFSVRLVSAAQ